MIEYPEYTVIRKFNTGVGAVLCNVCGFILTTGVEPYPNSPQICLKCWDEFIKIKKDYHMKDEFFNYLIREFGFKNKEYSDLYYDLNEKGHPESERIVYKLTLDGRIEFGYDNGESYPHFLRMSSGLGDSESYGYSIPIGNDFEKLKNTVNILLDKQK